MRKVWVISINKQTDGQGWTETQQWKVRLLGESKAAESKLRCGSLEQCSVSGKDELIRARVPADRVGWRGER